MEHNKNNLPHASALERFMMKAKSSIFISAELIEYLVAFTIIIAILGTLLHLPTELGSVFAHGGSHLKEYLEYVVNIIIALELVHVLCHQTLDSIVEILSIAITRELVLSTLKTYEILIGICAIAVLFVMRKYLFIAKLDDDDDVQHTQSLKHALFGGHHGEGEKEEE